MKIGKIIGNTLSRISPRFYMRLSYAVYRGGWPNFKNPKDLSEIWLKWMLEGGAKKIYYLADKYKVRDYVQDRIGEQYLTPLLGVYKSANDIDFDSLPERFALKLNFGAGMNVICPDKNRLDRESTRRRLDAWMNKGSYRIAEGHYDLIDRRIVCEEFVDDGSGHFPVDYKFMCLKGKAYCVLVCSDRDGEAAHYSPYSLDWKPLREYKKDGQITAYNKPDNFDKMVDLAEKLAEGLDLVRVDLYSNGRQIWFGEMTLTPSGCLFHRWTKKAMDDMGEYYRTH